MALGNGIVGFSRNIRFFGPDGWQRGLKPLESNGSRNGQLVLKQCLSMLPSCKMDSWFILEQGG
jgi:hypothetical protein